MTRIILSILRQAAEPLTTPILPSSCSQSGRWTKNDMRLLRLMTKRVGVSLRGQRGGLLRSIRDRGGTCLWEIQQIVEFLCIAQP